ncbi:peptidoglycan editing factor PgeF [Aliiglaciecola sp. M165]|uniref:peptidoglycan editing factor PgeF n=1 Tax=Aliiglaciecola sp. M165 TaxID=2593649 RepID=UPI00117CE375|nr:peptidoglycan editing factor PgeF [Aliiglaciecola sp. M165]TRY29495.1 peptidoglycan editing factor PgeF [Aliiglaciecola sp. M165]
MTEQLATSVITPHWQLPEGVCAFYSNRNGGDSETPYDSNNLALHVGDDSNDVISNREFLPMSERIAWLNQVHSSRCVKVTDDYFLSLEPAKADASFTSQKATVCGVLTADCAPILIADQSASCVAAIHAGWRGLASGVIQNTITALPVTPESLTIWVGPHISQTHFQVGEDVKSAFEQYPEAFVEDKQAGKFRCSLFAIIETILHSMHVPDVINSGICTFEQHNAFFSHRHAQNNNVSHTGRFISGIYLKP